jgi:MFS transporter, UMF1 family
VFVDEPITGASTKLLVSWECEQTLLNMTREYRINFFDDEKSRKHLYTYCTTIAQQRNLHEMTVDNKEMDAVAEADAVIASAAEAEAGTKVVVAQQKHYHEEDVDSRINRNNIISMEEDVITTTTCGRQLSVSEAACHSPHSGWKAPFLINLFEIPFRIKDFDDTVLSEATGWCMDATARAPLNQMGGFVGTAILRLATIDAGCKTVFNCNNTVRGFKPSSFLTVTSTVVSIVGAVLMPIFGAVIDHTKYRKHIGAITAFLVVGFTGLEMLISQRRNNWFFILVIDSFQSFFLNVHSTASLAYLPDLTLDEKVLTHYVSQFAFRQFGNQVLYILMLLASGYAYGTDQRTAADTAVFTARVAAGMAFGYGVLLYGYSWLFLFRQRPALSKVPEGTSLLTTGFVQVGKTTRKIWADYNALKWFLLSLLWTPEAGSGIILSIAVSFFTIELNYKAQDLAIATLTFMVGTVLGVALSKLTSRWVNPLNNYRLGLLVLCTTIAISVGVLDGPSKIAVSFIFTMVWGIGVGWYVPSQRILYCTLIPKGQETEMMGIISFYNQILQWLPPLLVTLLNENSIPLQYGLLVVSGFVLLAILFTLPMGSYIDASYIAAHDSSAKLQEVLLATSGGDISFIRQKQQQQQKVNVEDVMDPIKNELEEDERGVALNVRNEI